MDTDQEKIEWNLTVTVDGHERMLRTAGEVRDFLFAYRDFYEFIREAPGKIKPRTSVYHPVNWATSLNSIERTLDLAFSDSTQMERVKQWLALNAESKLPFHTSFAAHTIKRIWEEEGPVTGAGAALFASGNSETDLWTNTDVARGMIAFVVAKSAIVHAGASDARNALSRARLEHDDAIASLATLTHEVETNFTDTIKRNETDHKELTNWILNATQKHSSELQEAAATALAEMENTRKTYTEFMRLKASVEYWKGKATSHSTGRAIYGPIAAAWLAFGGLGNGLFIWWLFEQAVAMAGTPDHVGVPITILASLGTLGFLATTVYFWVSRILVRLFLSEVHLGMDANERVVMVQSYLALSNEGVVDPEHRSIVLSALFRPTQDGIVKDDAAADPTLIGMLAQLRR